MGVLSDGGPSPNGLIQTGNEPFTFAVSLFQFLFSQCDGKPNKDSNTFVSVRS